MTRASYHQNHTHHLSPLDEWWTAVSKRRVSPMKGEKTKRSASENGEGWLIRCTCAEGTRDISSSSSLSAHMSKRKNINKQRNTQASKRTNNETNKNGTAPSWSRRSLCKRGLNEAFGALILLRRVGGFSIRREGGARRIGLLVSASLLKEEETISREEGDKGAGSLSSSSGCGMTSRRTLRTIKRDKNTMASVVRKRRL